MIKPLCTFVLIAPAALGSPLYSQGPGETPGLGYFSHDAPKPTRNFKHADNFTIGQSVLVDRVSWWGLSEGLFEADLSNFDTFTVEFFTNMDTSLGRPRPADLLLSATFAIGDTGAMATGRVAPNGAVEYRHEAALAAPILLEGGVEYHIAISAGFIDPAGDAWMWQDGQFVDGLSSIFSYTNNRWTFFDDTDSAFELYGMVVPAPGGAVVLVMGAGWRRRR